MMKELLRGFHPTFDALSAHVDRSDVDALRTRVGRHVARCARCRETVDEIRALGDLARARELSGVPEGMWARIESAATSVKATERTMPLATFAERTRTTEAPRPPMRDVRPWLGVTAIAAVLTMSAVLIVNGSRQTLGAESPSRLTLEREFVKPGQPLSMRYRPTPALEKLDHVTVWAWYVGGPVDVESDARDVLVRAGSLRRASPQEFLGSVNFPAGVRVAGYVVGDSLGRVIDRAPGRARFLAVALTADDAGRPSFDALVTLLGDRRMGADLGVVERAAASLERHYPDQPETWFLTYPVRHRGVVSDIVALFASRERVYAGWHEKLKDRRPLSFETELMMTNMASGLMDTARHEFWVERLVREHAQHPLALAPWIAKHRDVPADSARVVLDAFEPMWEAVGPNASGASQALALAERSGDPELVRRWRLRSGARNPYWVIDSRTASWLTDSATLSEFEARLRAQLAEAVRDSLGAPTIWSSAGGTSARNFHRRQQIETRLAAIQLMRGDALRAKSALDAIVRRSDERPSCRMPETMRWRAEAARRLGEMAVARDDLAYVATTENWRIAVVGDSVRQLLGAAYSDSAWARAKSSARALHRECWAAGRVSRMADG